MSTLRLTPESLAHPLVTPKPTKVSGWLAPVQALDGASSLKGTGVPGPAWGSTITAMSLAMVPGLYWGWVWWSDDDIHSQWDW